MEHKQMRMGLFVAVAVLAGCGKKEAVTVAQKPAAVESLRVEAHEFRDEAKYAALVEPVAQVDLAFRTGGEVVALYTVGGRALEPGDAVPAGAVLASLRLTEYQARLRSAEAQVGDMIAAKGSAEAQWKEAQAAQVQAEADARRGQALFSGQAMTRAELDAVVARVEGARARVEAARRNLEAFESRIAAAKAVRDESAVPLIDTKLIAPFAGVVVARRVEKGSTVSAGYVGYTLADLRQVKVSFGVPDVMLRNVVAGSTVSARFEAISDKSYAAKVVAIAPVADPATRLFRVQSILANSGLAVKAGMVGTVVLGQKVGQQLPAVPLRAVRRGQNESFAVMAVVGERLELRNVALGPVEGPLVGIADGLRAGEVVVADGAPRLKAGDVVRSK